MRNKTKILDSAEREALIKRHRTERDGRIRDRIKAVLLADDGWTAERIAVALFIDEQTVRQHLRDYQESKKLKPENGGSSSKLNREQAAELTQHLDNKLYTKIKDICAYVFEKYGIRYSVRGMTDWLKRQGFTFHQPCGVPAKADAVAQEVFVKEYEKLKSTLPEGDHILFMDGVHPSHAVRFVRGWIRKGRRVEVPTNASQKRLNLLGALNLEAMTLNRKDYKTLNADSVIDFLGFLLVAIPTGILHIILDRGRYQYCQAVWDFVEKNPRITLHYLPSYSPNLNAIEPAWQIMHEHTTNNQYHRTFKDFTEKINEFFDKTFPEKAKEWTDRLTDHFRTLNSPLTSI
jgi:transposase